MKTPSYSFAAALAGVLIVSSPFSAFTQEKNDSPEKGKAKAEKKEGKGKRAAPFRGTVKTSDRNSMSLTIEGKDKVQVVVISSETRIMKGGKPATFGDIAVGDEVQAVVKPNAEGKETAELIQIQPATDSKEKDAKKEEKKDGEKKDDKKKKAE